MWDGMGWGGCGMGWVWDGMRWGGCGSVRLPLSTSEHINTNVITMQWRYDTEFIGDCDCLAL